MIPPRPTAKTRMEHSIGSSIMNDGYTVWDDDSFVHASPPRKKKAILAFPAESNTLFAIPKGLSPVYRPLSTILRLFSMIFSVSVGLFTTWSRVALLAAWHNVWNGRFLSNAATKTFPWRDLMLCAIKSISVYIVATGILQELPAFRPGRLDTHELEERYYLPTKLSFYRGLKNVQIGKIHWIQAENNSKDTSIRFTHAHFNHGFGASSLSWLPALPLLVDRLGILQGFSHDAPGFGFTYRSSYYIDDYSTERSAEIGLELLKEHALSEKSTVLLVGHSLGAYTTLQMALKMNQSVKLRIILVSPAFGIRKQSSKSSVSTKPRRKQGIWSSSIDMVAAFALRRIVSSPGFIQRGLQFAWANKVKDSDILRFQWPLIARGWERGLLRFARAPLVSDERLLRRVLALPNVEAVDVVMGQEDRVVKVGDVRKFLAAFPTISLSTIAKCGHDPFEENPEAFAEQVNCLLTSGESF